jgi:2-keto-4-pentenoate hydratase
VTAPRLADGWTDPLAEALAGARETGTAIDPEAWGEVALDRGKAVAAELYAAARASGAVPLGAKIGAIDPVAQERLGIDKPFTAPLLSDGIVEDGATLSLAALVTPLIELEVGLCLRDGRPRPVACVEIADSRIGWALTIGRAHADFGCQGRMLFGAPGPEADPDTTVRAVARHDGTEVTRGEGPVAVAAARLPLVAEHLAALPAGTEALVATGSLNAPVPLEPGDWEFDFGTLGTLRLRVTA